MICFIFFQNLNKFVTSQHIKGPNVNFIDLTINATSIEYNTIQLNLKIYRNL